MDYYAKYIKYKTKYLELKKQIETGGGWGGCTEIKCKCKEFKATTWKEPCTTCKHSFLVHVEK
jgi:hypothetical protein